MFKMSDYFDLGAEWDLCRSGSTVVLVVVIFNRLEQYKVSVFFTHIIRGFCRLTRRAKETSDEVIKSRSHVASWGYIFGPLSPNPGILARQHRNSRCSDE